MSIEFLAGDCLTVLRTLPEGSVDMCVTSPPYYGLRDYGVVGQVGLEATPEAYVAKMVEVFREVKRVVKDDGTLWLNIGDSYARNPAKGQHKPGDSGKQAYVYDQGGGRASSTAIGNGLKAKDLIGIPWMLAFALRADGWYLRQDIIWHKPNVMPESVRDRCTKAHEYLFMLSKSERYRFDADAIREPHASPYSRDAISKAGKAGGNRPSGNNFSKQTRQEDGVSTPKTRADRAALLNPNGRNRRSVWSINTKPYRGAHFATFPPALIEPCILAGCPVGGTVLDPFGGSGTTGQVAQQHGRNAILIELNPAYVELARKRCGVSSEIAAAVELTGSLIAVTMG